jgi:hypothetical protein
MGSSLLSSLVVGIILCSYCIGLVDGQYANWSMQDRFKGIRYSVQCGGGGEEGVVAAIVREADRLRGFGWVQIVRDDRVDGRRMLAGEFRGKIAGQSLPLTH